MYTIHNLFHKSPFPKLVLCRPEKKKVKYTGLEHRQTLRACDFHCNLQIEIENENIDK